ncbi:MAG: hypothetical protein ACLRXC_07920 [[Clostridium] leptum]
MGSIDFHRCFIAHFNFCAQLLQDLQGDIYIVDVWDILKTQGSSANKTAGIIATAAFFAPLMTTSPSKRLGPSMKNFSISVSPLSSFSLLFPMENAGNPAGILNSSIIAQAPAK